MKEFTAPKGVPDYLPPDSFVLNTLRQRILNIAHRAGYQDIELPIFENTALFARGVGQSSDVVSKEMYTFTDRSNRSVTLRPEGTAGVVRAIIEHGLDRGPLPVKLCYSGPFFRYERPQAGRYRQLQQVGLEAIGVDDPALDAELITVAYRSLESVGLTGFRLEITSLGDETCRPAYRNRLQEFLLHCDLDPETRQRAQINPLRVLDDKRDHIKEMTAHAPLMIDFLSSSAREHFDCVLTHLDALQIEYVINPRMVRGLDYYTKTTFEFVHDQLGAQSGIGGGGRYDGLMKELGGVDVSGAGFGLGLDRIMLALAQEDHSPSIPAECQIFMIGLTHQAKCHIAVIADHLRSQGISVDCSYGNRGIKQAMRSADRSGARIALIVGDRDLTTGTIVMKNLTTGEQRDIPFDQIYHEVRTLL